MLALCLAAVDLGPLFEGLSGSRRAGGFSYAERAGWSLSHWQLIELLAPAFWSPPDLAFFNVPAATGSSSDPPYLISLYFGAALPLALASPFREKRARWIGGATILFFLIAAGPAVPLHRLVSSLPLLNSGRYAIKYLLFASAGIAVLAALTVAQLRERAKALAIASLILSGLALAGWTTLGTPEAADLLRAGAKPMSNVIPSELFATADIASLALEEMRPRLLHGLIACASMGALAIAATRSSSRWLPAAAVAILSLDLATAAARAIPSAPVSSARLPDRALALLSDRTLRVAIHNPPAVPALPGDPFEAQVAHRARFGLDGIGRFRTFEALDVDAQQGALWDRILEQAETMDAARYRRLLARAGVRYDLRASRAEDPVALEVPDLKGAPIYVHSIPDALPYLRAATSWRSASAYVDQPLSEAILFNGSTSTTTCAATVEPIELGFDRIEARVRSECPSLLIAQEIWRPRWQATVDGETVRVATADVGYVAAPVPAGDHLVELKYASATASWWPLSLLGCSILIALYTISRRLRMKLASATSAMQ